MKKQDKEILRFLVEKELEAMQKTEINIEFPSPVFIESRQLYEEKLKEILNSLK